MTPHYDTLAEFERDGFRIRVDKTDEDLDVADCFEDSTEVPQIYQDINSGRYEWFMVRVQVMIDDVELAAEYLGGCLYEDAREVLTDGLVEDLLLSAMPRAIERALELKHTLIELDLESRLDKLTSE